MESRKIVYHETAIVAAGVAIGVAAMLAIFALLDLWSMAVLLGGVIGGLLAVLNFFVMAICVSLAADRAEQQNVKGGQALLQASYIGRMAVLALVLFACARSGLCNVVALAVPLIFPRIAITFGEFFRKKGA